MLFLGTPSQSYGTSLAIRDHLPPDTSERAPPNPSHAGWYSIYLPGGMGGWVYLVDLIAPRPGVEPAIFWSRVRRPATAPPRYAYDTRLLFVSAHLMVSSYRFSAQCTHRCTVDRCPWDALQRTSFVYSRCVDLYVQGGSKKPRLFSFILGLLSINLSVICCHRLSRPHRLTRNLCMSRPNNHRIWFFQKLFYEIWTQIDSSFIASVKLVNFGTVHRTEYE